MSSANGPSEPASNNKMPINTERAGRTITGKTITGSVSLSDGRSFENDEEEILYTSAHGSCSMDEILYTDLHRNEICGYVGFASCDFLPNQGT